MNLFDYENNAQKTAHFYSEPEYPFLALAEEAGEVLGKLAKASRKMGKPIGQILTEIRNGEHTELYEALVSELGDVLWQVQAAANELGVSVVHVAQVNNEKTLGRLERGTVVGEGDQR